MTDTTADAWGRLKQAIEELYDVTVRYEDRELARVMARIRAAMSEMPTPPVAVTEADEPLVTDAMVMERIAQLEAKVARLQRYGHLWEDDFRETMQGWHDEFVDSTIQQMRDECLQPGDLDAVRNATEQRG